VRELRSERDRLETSIHAAQQPRGHGQAEQDRRIAKAVDMLSRLREKLTTAPVVRQRELLRLAVKRVDVWSTQAVAGGRFRLERGVVHLRPDMWLPAEDQPNLLGSPGMDLPAEWNTRIELDGAAGNSPTNGGRNSLSLGTTPLCRI
jgi:hypothetical protein